MQYVEGLLKGEKRSAAKLITLIENEGKEKNDVIKKIYPYTGNAFVIGITGSPGAGKSSLVDELTRLIRSEGHKVGIIAVDPTSPFSGGALLGDRIRMQEIALDKGVFIRSMGTRGSLGGLSRATKDVVKILDAFGSKYIIIETVGVGQSELDIMHYADTTVVVLTPGAGDHIQTIKAGIMEIADIFVINKSDLGGTQKIKTDIESMLDLSPLIKDWRPPVLQTSTIKEQGLKDLWQEIKNHQEYKTSQHQNEAGKRMKMEVFDIVMQSLKCYVEENIMSNGKLEGKLQQMTQRQLDPYTVADEIINKFFNLKGDKPDV